MGPKDAERMANSVDPHQTALSGQWPVQKLRIITVRYLQLLTSNFQLYLIFPFDQVENFFMYGFRYCETIHPYYLISYLK